VKAVKERSTYKRLGAAAVSVAPPATPKLASASTASPAWLARAQVGQWIPIPNSQLMTHLGDAYFERIGLPRPSKRGNIVSWGKNKYGVTWNTWENQSWGGAGGLSTFSGMAVDTRGSKILIGGGDCHWAENGYHEFQFGIDAPVWTQAVIAPCHKDYFKQPNNEGQSPHTYPALAEGDDGRVDRMYDGSHRGGPSYWFQVLVERRGWIVHFGQQQFWPVDSGTSPNVHVADLKTGKWRTDNPIAEVPNWNNDELAWKQKHPITEDVYSWGTARWDAAGVLSVWRVATNSWEAFLSVPEEAGVRLSGSIDWTSGYVLFAGSKQPGAAHRYWMTDLASPKKVPVTLAGPHAAAFQPYRNGGLWWCPDLRMHLYYNDDGFIYTIKKTGPAEFTVDRLPLTGRGPASGDAQHKAGGILNNFQYIPALRGMVLRLGDLRPMYFVRTG
jgi:hypothetical protein